jgi:hypothetical protein
MWHIIVTDGEEDYPMMTTPMIRMMKAMTTNNEDEDNHD